MMNTDNTDRLTFQFDT